jgi:1,4-dihydroxy-2-naphthoate octaprenyltransferase
MSGIEDSKEQDAAGGRETLARRLGRLNASRQLHESTACGVSLQGKGVGSV